MTDSNGENLPVPIGTDDSEFEALVERFLTLYKKTAENVIRLGETLVEAKSKFDTARFCAAVGLEEGSTEYKRWLKIGQEASRLWPFVDRLPNSRRTIFNLSRLERDVFDRVTQDKRFTPMMTDADLTLIVGTGKKERDHRLQADVVISFGDFDEAKKLEVCKRLKELGDEYHCEYIFSRRLEKQLVKTPTGLHPVPKTPS